MFLLIGVLSVNSYAAEKYIELNLENDYEAANFILTFEEAGEYKATLSNGKLEYEFNVVDDCTMECLVNDCRSGKWKIFIDDGNPDNLNLCKVTASVKAKTNTETEAVGNIKVAQQIAGLKAYMKDDSVVVRWDDQTCGDVIIKIQDIDTNRILAEEKVRDNYFSFAISEEIRNILVSCVPATSKGVQNAVITFNLNTYNNPDVVVSYIDEGITNKTDYDVVLTADGQYKADILLNGEPVLQNISLSAGNNNIVVPLKKEGNNIVSIEIMSDNGYIKTYSHEVILDITAPKFVLDKEYDGIRTDESTILISGYVSNYKTVNINDVIISDIKTDGYFEYTTSLHNGENELFLKAVDDAGNETVYNLFVYKEEEKKFDIKASDIIFYGLLFIILVVALIIKNKKTRMFSKRDRKVSIVPLNSDNEDDSFVDNISKEVQESNENIQRKGDLNVHKLSVKAALAKDKLHVFCMKSKGKENMEKKISTENKKVLIWIVAWFLFIGILMTKVIIPANVPTTSMAPTILKDKKIIIYGLAYIGNKSPERGDIVSFKSDEYDMNMVKRVIGLPGDVITFKNGDIYINDMLCDESAYLENDVETNCMHTFTVPEDCYFMLGDNRENSNDSRFWKNPYIKGSDIIGEVISIYSYPWE